MKDYNDDVILGWYAYQVCWKLPNSDKCKGESSVGIIGDRIHRLQGKFFPKWVGFVEVDISWLMWYNFKKNHFFWSLAIYFWLVVTVHFIIAPASFPGFLCIRFSVFLFGARFLYYFSGIARKSLSFWPGSMYHLVWNQGCVGKRSGPIMGGVSFITTWQKCQPVTNSK